eukprot:6184701-Pleurochrysis_carterae.AAC.3
MFRASEAILGKRQVPGLPGAAEAVLGLPEASHDLVWGPRTPSFGVYLVNVVYSASRQGDHPGREGSGQAVEDAGNHQGAGAGAGAGRAYGGGSRPGAFRKYRSAMRATGTPELGECACECQSVTNGNISKQCTAARYVAT